MNKDFARGMIVSLALKSLPVRKKTPIAYLYNGVRLPALPEWDRAAYPYAWISYWTEYRGAMGTFIPVGFTTHTWLVHFNSSVSTAVNSGYDCIMVEEDAPWYQIKWFEYDDGTTSEMKTDWGAANYSTGQYVTIDGTIWANVNIYMPDGTLLIAASEPVPVYE